MDDLGQVEDLVQVEDLGTSHMEDLGQVTWGMEDLG